VLLFCNRNVFRNMKFSLYFIVHFVEVFFFISTSFEILIMIFF